MINCSKSNEKPKCLKLLWVFTNGLQSVHSAKNVYNDVLYISELSVQRKNL